MQGDGRSATGFYGLDPISSELIGEQSEPMELDSNTKSANRFASDMQEVDLRVQDRSQNEQQNVSNPFKEHSINKTIPPQIKSREFSDIIVTSKY